MQPQPRQQQRERWLAECLDRRGERLLEAPADLRADASFRRFQRVHTDAGTRVLMDAPPERENNSGFLAVAAWLERADLPAPRVLAADEAAGFLLVTDLGDDTLARAVAASPGQADALYDAAVDALVAFQTAGLRDRPALPAYDDARLELENGIFGEWYLAGRLGLPAAPPVLTDALAALTAEHLAAPRVPVHLDWHGRNLLPAPGGAMAMVDFQDARIGPQGYDLVSLLRDCYTTLPAARVERLLARFLDAAETAGLPGVDDADAFRRTFDLVGMQRHLKAIGIFARLSLRDRRPHALPDIPRTLDYLLAVAPRHPETADLAAWLATEVVPREAALIGEAP